MKHGEFILVTESAQLLKLGLPGVLRPVEVEEQRVASALAVVLSPEVGRDHRDRLGEICRRLHVPLMSLMEDGEFSGDAFGTQRFPALELIKEYQRLVHKTQLAPENYAKIELQTLVDIITTTNSLLKPREVMDSVMTQINELIACQAWSVLIVDEDDPSHLTFSAAMGPNKDSLFRQRIPMGEGIAGWVAEHSEPVIVNDVSKDARFFDKIDKNTNFQTESVLCAPLISRGRTIGVIEMLNRDSSGGFSEADLELVEILVNPAAVAIENAFLF